MNDRSMMFCMSAAVSLLMMYNSSIFNQDASYISYAVLFFILISFWIGAITIMELTWDLGKAFSKMIWSKFS